LLKLFAPLKFAASKGAGAHETKASHAREVAVKRPDLSFILCRDRSTKQVGLTKSLAARDGRFDPPLYRRPHFGRRHKKRECRQDTAQPRQTDDIQMAVIVFVKFVEFVVGFIGHELTRIKFSTASENLTAA